MMLFTSKRWVQRSSCSVLYSSSSSSLLSSPPSPIIYSKRSSSNTTTSSSSSSSPPPPPPTSSKVDNKKIFIQTMMKRYRDAAITPQHEATIIDLKDRMLDLAVRCMNKAQIECFGSVVTKFSKPNADVDLSVTYRNFSPWHQGIPRVSDQDHRRLTRFCREASGIGMEQVRYVRARIPVVQLVDPITSLHVDVSIGNVGGVANSKILSRIRNIFPDFIGAFIHTIKEWGKAREVIAPEKSTFNSFTMTTMGLMVLQELGLVPIFDHPTGAFGELLLEDVEAKCDSFSLPPIYQTLRGDDAKLGEAVLFCLQRFAEYYHSFDFHNGTVSLMCPRRHRRLYQEISKKHVELIRNHKKKEWEKFYKEHPEDGDCFSDQAFEEAMHHEEVQRNGTSPFIVEDFVNYVNCARRVAPACVSHVKAELALLHQHLQQESELDIEVINAPSHRLTKSFLPEHMDPRVSLFKSKQ